MKKRTPYIFEMCIWLSALIYLAILNPLQTQSISFCPLHNVGFTYCPGCGLGRSISFLLHGDIIQSFRTHLIGIPAVGILFHRIVQLYRNIRYFNQLQRS